MRVDWLDPRFGLPATVLTAVLAGYLVAVHPLLARRRYGRLVREPEARARYLGRVVTTQWTLAGLVALAVLADPRLTTGDLGLWRPAGPYRGQAAAFTAVLCAALLLSAIPARARARRGKRIPGQRGYAALLPRTRRERWLALAVSVGAAVNEELAYRGLFVAAGVGLLGLPPVASALVVTVAFGLLHAYQGWLGVFGTAYTGLILAGLYLASGSLILPVLVHLVMNIRGLLLVPAPSLPPAGPRDEPAPVGAPREEPAALREEPAALRLRPAVASPPVPPQ